MTTFGVWPRFGATQNPPPVGLRLTRPTRNKLERVYFVRLMQTYMHRFGQMAPEDEAELEGLRSLDHELDFIKIFLGQVRNLLAANDVA